MNRRKPKAHAEITGAAMKNPKRYRGWADPAPTELGAPPNRLSEDERLAWDELATELPWLARSDRKLIEITVKLIARLRRNPEMGLNGLAQLRLCLQALGATPSDRSRIVEAPEPIDPEAARFLS